MVSATTGLVAMSKEPHDEYRLQQRAELWADYGGLMNATCAMKGCSSPPRDMHELINRALTPVGSDVRRATYNKHLCVLLCRRCHEAAHNPGARQSLIQSNVGRYGYDAVQEALERVTALSGGLINIHIEDTIQGDT